MSSFLVDVFSQFVVRNYLGLGKSTLLHELPYPLNDETIFSIVLYCLILSLRIAVFYQGHLYLRLVDLIVTSLAVSLMATSLAILI